MSIQSGLSMIKENKEIIRLVLECLVVLFLFYYFNKRISKMTKHIEEISQRLELQDDLIQKQTRIINEFVKNTNTDNVFEYDEMFVNEPVVEPIKRTVSPESQSSKQVRFDKPQQPIVFDQTQPPIQPKKNKVVEPTRAPPTPQPTRQNIVEPRLESIFNDFPVLVNLGKPPPKFSDQEIEIIEEEKDDPVVVEKTKTKPKSEDDLDKELESELNNLD